MWETEEDDVVTREDLDSGLFEYPRREWKQVRMMLTERRTGVATGGQRTDNQAAVDIGGVPEKQTQNLTTGVPTGAGNGDSDRLACVLGRTTFSHVTQYASLCIGMHNYLPMDRRIP